MKSQLGIPADRHTMEDVVEFTDERLTPLVGAGLTTQEGTTPV